MKVRSFDNYEQYVAVQTETNKQKLTHVWVTERELRKVAAYVRRTMPGASSGICHGVRNGYEVATFRRLLGIDVIGTEISDTATQFPNVIQWDYHDVKDEWLGRCDFIYSNSWDHSFDPNVMLERWMSCLRPTGRCFLQWTRNHMPKSIYGADCFGINYGEFIGWLGKRYVVERVIRLNKIPPSQAFTHPLRWFKYLLLPVRVVVVRNK